MQNGFLLLYFGVICSQFIAAVILRIKQFSKQFAILPNAR